MPRKWGIPPKEKIPEAWSAIADGRVQMGQGQALVTSSTGKKVYTVTWAGDEYSANDNASYWQGYMGYPLLTVLMLQNRVPYKEEIAAHFRGVPWKS